MPSSIIGYKWRVLPNIKLLPAINVVVCVCMAAGHVFGQVPGIGDPLVTRGLVGWYSFEGEGDGFTIDRSGNDNNGIIHGAIRVSCPYGAALQFDGKDDYVNLGNASTLRINGDLSVQVWLKTEAWKTVTDNKMRHRLIVGSSAGQAVQRNYNLRIDHNNDVFIECGNGRKTFYVVHEDGQGILDDSWHQITFLHEDDLGLLYIDGKLIDVVPANGIDPMPSLFDIHIGGWGYGYFSGQIAEVRIYNRAISTAEIIASCGGNPDTSLHREGLHCGYSYLQNAIVLEDIVECTSPIESAIASITAIHSKSGKILAQRNLTLESQTRPGSGRYAIDTLIPLRNPPEGRYQVHMGLEDQAGTSLADATDVIEILQRPSWMNGTNTAGDKVLSPWTPCKVDHADDKNTVSVWGRQYTFSSSAFLEQITSSGTTLLSQPVRLHCSSNGNSHTFTHTTPEIVKSADNIAELHQNLSGGSLTVSIDSSIEFDGFMRCDWTLTAEESLIVDTIVLEFPLSSEWAKYLYCYPVTHSGVLGQQWHSPFRPILFVGDEQRGLSWIARSDQYWFPLDNDHAIEMLREDDRVIMRFNIVGQPTALQEGESWSYSFGLQAAPVRPMEKNYWQIRQELCGPYSNEYAWLTDATVDGMPYLDFYKGLGVRSVFVSRWWDIFGYPLPTGAEHKQLFAQLVNAVHDKGMNVVPYMIGFLLSHKADEYQYFWPDMLQYPEKLYPIDSLAGLPKQYCSHICMDGPYRDWAVAMAGCCMDTYNIDGIYLDSSARPLPCSNPRHGCGYTLPDGTRRPTYPVFGCRELMKQLYATVKSRKSDGYVELHVYDAFHVPAMTFATGIITGEQLRKQEYALDAISLERFRAEFCGYNTGIPADILSYNMSSFENCLCLTQLHDIPTRASTIKTLKILSSIWKIRERFGADESRWYPYWNNSNLIRITGPGGHDCYASLYRHDDNGVLAYICNLGKQSRQVQVTFNLDALALTNTVDVIDMITNKRMKLREESLSLELSPQQWSYICIKTTGK